jgi:hypothetical protein
VCVGAHKQCAVAPDVVAHRPASAPPATCYLRSQWPVCTYSSVLLILHESLFPSQCLQAAKHSCSCPQVVQTSIKQLASFDFTKTDGLESNLFTLDLLTRAPLLQHALVSAIPGAHRSGFVPTLLCAHTTTLCSRSDVLAWPLASAHDKLIAGLC